MSQAGYLAWYSNNDVSKPDAIRILRALPKLMGIDRSDTVYRSDLDEYLADEFLGSELFRLYEPGTMLRVVADSAELGNRIEAAVNSIPEEVKGDFLPNRPFLRIGCRDSFVDAADEASREVPYTIMVGCWGYSTPSNTEKMRSQLFSHTAVHAEKMKLEHLVGALDQALYLKF